MNSRKIWCLFCTYVVYILFLIVSWILTYYRLFSFPIKMTMVDIADFCSLDLLTYSRDILIFLLFSLIVFHPLKANELIKMTRFHFFKINIKRLSVCSLCMACTEPLLNTILMLLKFFNLKTLLDANYFIALLLNMSFYWVCYMFIGMLFFMLFTLFLHKWKAAILTVFIVVCFYAIHLIFHVDLLFAAGNVFDGLYDYRGFMNPVPYEKWGSAMLEYVCCTLILGFACKSQFQKRDVMEDA